jgi:hypothetical protein
VAHYLPQFRLTYRRGERRRFRRRVRIGKRDSRRRRTSENSFPAWSYFALGENQCCVATGGYMDYDDIAVSTTGRIGP